MSLALSIVIPTMGRPIVIRTVESLLSACRGMEVEILVCGEIPDPSVHDKISLLAATNTHVRHFPVRWETGDSSRKKNHGAAQARAEIVAFLDDDVVVAPDWPKQILAAFEDPAVGLVSGPSLIPEDITLSCRLVGLALTSRAAGYVADRYRGGASAREVNWSRIIGCNAAYRKSVFKAMGEFPPEFYPGEEMIAAWRTQQLGHKMVFIPQAWVHHYPRQSVKRFWRQVWGYGATRIRLIRAGTQFEWTTLVPAAWVLSLVVLVPAALMLPIASLLLNISLMLYLLMALLVTAETIIHTRRPADALVFFMIPVMHLSYGLSEWFEFFRPDRDYGDHD